MIKESKHIEEEEIDILELFQTIWKRKRIIFRSVAVFGVIGLFVAVFSPKEFTAKTIVVPQTQQSSKGGNLGGLAAMAGINIEGNSSNDISPMLYPKIVSSIPFLKELLKVSLKFNDLDSEVTYEEYYEVHKKVNLLEAIKRYTIGLPGVILKMFKRDGKDEALLVKKTDSIYRLTRKEKDLFNQIQSQLKVESNDKEGFVTIYFSMPEAEASAKMLQKAQELLQSFITEFKINKAKEELIFIEERYSDAKKEFDKKQYTLANFRDRNRNLSTSRSQARLQRLQSDYNLAFGVYSELAKKLEGQRIEVKKNTPVFTVIEPVSVPVQKSKPKRVMILIVWLFLGGVLGVVSVFIREWIRK